MFQNKRKLFSRRCTINIYAHIVSRTIEHENRDDTDVIVRMVHALKVMTWFKFVQPRDIVIDFYVVGNTKND